METSHIKLNFRVDKETDDMLIQFAVSNKLSKSKAIRQLLKKSLMTKDETEQLLINRIDALEKELFNRIDNKFINFDSKFIKILMYVLTNHHLIKLFIAKDLHSDLEPEKSKIENINMVSLAKMLSLYHPIDSINSKTRFEDNILQEHLDTDE